MASRQGNDRIELLVGSINYIVIQYALSQMCILMQRHVVWILLFAARIWGMGQYWEQLTAQGRRKSTAALLFVLCEILQLVLLCVVSRTSGGVLPVFYE